MSEEEIYQNFVDWLGKTWWGLTPSEQLMPLMKARYTIQEAEFLKAAVVFKEACIGCGVCTSARQIH